MNMKKLLAFALCLVLVSGLSVAGTIAWLQASTEEIVNTFTPSGIEIKLIETKKPDGTEVTTGVTDWSAQLVPGMTYHKNPTVSVDGTKTNVDVYLFVKFIEDVNESVITYTSNLTKENSGWIKVQGEENVWYREVKVGDSVKSWELLDGNKVSIADTVKESELPTTNTTMKYTAYAIQTTGFTTVEAAWTEAQKLQ